MRLSRGEVIFVGLIIVISWYLLVPVVHSEANVHTLIGESGEGTSSSLDPMWALYHLASDEGINIRGWQLYWKKDVEPKEEEKMLRWLQEHPSFTLVVEEKAEGPGEGLILKQLWQSQDDSTLHQVQLIKYPHKSGYHTKFMYTWSGHQLENNWHKRRSEIENQFVNIFQVLPHNFTCLVGFTNDKLTNDMSKKNMFSHWLTDSLEGELREQIEDNNFISVTGYIPIWKEQYITHGDKKLNLQLSARYNALDQQTRVTIGYPLIITEH